MVRDADVVILARATAIGGSETVSPSTAEGAPATTIHRIRFSVSRVFRGDVGSLLDVADFDTSTAYPFEVGRDYLVFAEWRALGSEQRRELTPVGYYQGVYQRVDERTAVNTINGSVDLDSLPGLLG